MKIAHLAIVTPGRCGLYETTRELVRAERHLGLDAYIVDPAPTQFHPGLDSSERGVPILGEVAAKDADLIVNHSGCTGELERISKPFILMAHGRPAHSFQFEKTGGSPVYSYWYRKNKDDRYRAVVTFWPEHVPYLKVMFSSKLVRAIPPTVDLEQWSPQGPGGYGFGGQCGAFNVAIADAWRHDVDPYLAVNSVAVASKMLAGIKLHIYGKQGGDKAWPALLAALNDLGIVGEIKGWIKGLENVYRAADLLVTPHRIYTRTIREAMACGCPVVSGMVVPPEDIQATAEIIVARLTESVDRRSVRHHAERLFNPMSAARAMAAIVEEAVAIGC